MLHSYTMSFMDEGCLLRRKEYLAVDDSAAIRHALTFSKTHLIEVFQGPRLIARVPKGALGYGPIGREDPHSPTEHAQ